MICPRSVPTEVSSSVPKTVKDLFGLCHAAGCFCYLDGKVYCTIQRAVLWHIYARYAHDCENKWCTCSEIREATDAAKTCSKNLEAAWSGYLATLKTKSPCCEGNQLVPQVSDKLGVLYGVSQAIGFAKGLIVGICVDSTRLASGLSSRSMETTISSPIKLGSSSELHKRMVKYIFLLRHGACY